MSSNDYPAYTRLPNARPRALRRMIEEADRLGSSLETFSNFLLGLMYPTLPESERRKALQKELSDPLAFDEPMEVGGYDEDHGTCLRPKDVDRDGPIPFS